MHRLRSDKTRGPGGMERHQGGPGHAIIPVRHQQIGAKTQCMQVNGSGRIRDS